VLVVAWVQQVCSKLLRVRKARFLNLLFAWFAISGPIAGAAGAAPAEAASPGVVPSEFQGDPINEALRTGKCATALLLCDKELALKLPNEAKRHLWYARSNAHMGLHEYQKAIADADQALRIPSADPLLSAGLYMNQGQAYEKLKNWSKAIEVYGKALVCEHNFNVRFTIQLLKNRANAFTELHKYDEAIADVNRGLAIVEASQKDKHKNNIAMGKAEQIKLMYLRSHIYECSGKLQEAKQDRALGDKLTEEF